VILSNKTEENDGFIWNTDTQQNILYKNHETSIALGGNFDRPGLSDD
jgi:hypothetical protein